MFGIFPEFWILKDDILQHSAKTTTTNCKFFKIKFLDLRLDYRLPRETPVIKLLTDSGQLSVQQKSAYHSILQVYKTLSTKELEYIFSKSVPEDETDNNKHTINRQQTSSLKNKFLLQGIKIVEWFTPLYQKKKEIGVFQNQGQGLNKVKREGCPQMTLICMLS